MSNKQIFHRKVYQTSEIDLLCFFISFNGLSISYRYPPVLPHHTGCIAFQSESALLDKRQVGLEIAFTGLAQTG